MQMDTMMGGPMGRRVLGLGQLFSSRIRMATGTAVRVVVDPTAPSIRIRVPEVCGFFQCQVGPGHTNTQTHTHSL